MLAHEVVTLLKLILTDEQRRAVGYLERRGQRFCVDFGWQNAVEKARQDWRQRRREQQHRRHRGEASTAHF